MKRLSESREEYDYVIELTQEIISPSLLILTRFEKQEIIKTYLDDILRKKWIRLNKLLMKTILFLIFKKSKKRLILDYRKLNNVTIIDSILLLLI